MSKPRGLKPGHIRWTPEHDAYLRENYSNKAIRMTEIMARTGGHPKEAIYKRAMDLGLASRAKGLDSGVGPRSLLALTLAARPEGVRAADMGNQAAALSCFSALRKRGMLFRGSLGVKTVRHFTTQAAADRYVSANIAAHKAKQKPMFSIKARPGWGPNDPIRTTPQTKYTYAASPPAVVYRTNTHSPL